MDALAPDVLHIRRNCMPTEAKSIALFKDWLMQSPKLYIAITQRKVALKLTRNQLIQFVGACKESENFLMHKIYSSFSFPCELSFRKSYTLHP